MAGPGSLGWLALGGAEGVAALVLVGADPGLGLPLVSQADPGCVLAFPGELDDLDFSALPGDLGLPGAACLLAGDECGGQGVFEAPDADLDEVEAVGSLGFQGVDPDQLGGGDLGEQGGQVGLPDRGLGALAGGCAGSVAKIGGSQR